MTKRDSSLSLREGRNCQNNTGLPEKKEEMKDGGRRGGRKRKEVERGERAIGAIATCMSRKNKARLVLRIFLRRMYAETRE